MEHRPTDEVLEDSTMTTIVSPVDNAKWKACLDARNDCRLASGTHVSAWMHVPTMGCDPRRSTKLATYSSSPGKTRGFCGTCGATVCFVYDRPGASATKAVSCIAVGLLRAPEGDRKRRLRGENGTRPLGISKRPRAVINDSFVSWSICIGSDATKTQEGDKASPPAVLHARRETKVLCLNNTLVIL